MSFAAVVASRRRNAGPPPTYIVGDSGLSGGGNWPASGDRGLFAPFLLDRTAHLISFNMRTRGASAGGNRFKGVVYAADAGGAPIGGVARPGTLLAVSDQSDVIGAGALALQMPISGTIAPGWIWIGYTANGSGVGSGSETDSGGTNANQTIMFNGSLTFATPPNPAPTWPGSPGPYGNVPSVWLVYS
ncbi:MAG: hypothetical protein NVV68_06785 [Dokdonella sp.]|nr:hypothetical protein [Dokdonella sp.]